MRWPYSGPSRRLNALAGFLWRSGERGPQGAALPLVATKGKPPRPPWHGLNSESHAGEPLGAAGAPAPSRRAFAQELALEADQDSPPSRYAAADKTRRALR
jgi:hypothetical protein